MSTNSIGVRSSKSGLTSVGLPRSSTTRPARSNVEVAIDLLDDDDGVLHTDSGTVTVVAGEIVTVDHEGSMPFDGAADVVSFRFRLLPSPPASR